MEIFNTNKLLKQISTHNIISQSITKQLNKRSQIHVELAHEIELDSEESDVANSELSDENLQDISTISNLIIYECLVLRQNLDYWKGINRSVWRKWYYGLQILPVKLLELGCYLQKHQWDVSCLDYSKFNYYKIIHMDIKRNIKRINRKLNSNYDTLQQLVTYELELSQIYHQLPLDQFGANNGSSANIESIEPNWIIKNWLWLTGGILIGPIMTQKVIINRTAIFNWIRDNLVSVVVGFYNNWIIQPIKDCINIIKQDSNIIASKESLNSDLSSLERMIKDYLHDNVSGDSSLSEEEVNKLIELGDLTMIMTNYEREMKSPIKNLLRGSLIRSILIQIQKTKVDGDIVISGIDKLIKSQQLLLAIVSISPSIIIIYQLVKYLTRPNFVINGKDVKNSCLNQLINLVNATNKTTKIPETARGELLVNIVRLKLESGMILNEEIFKSFTLELDKLLHEGMKYNELTNIFIIYSTYFK